MAITGLLVSMEGWVKSWTPGLFLYQNTGLSAQAEVKLTALVKLQIKKLAALGEETEMKLATGLETLLPQCARYTQVKNGEMVVDDVGLMAHLTEQLGLYSPLADQLAVAWFTALEGQEHRILTALEPQHQHVFDDRKQYESNNLKLESNLDKLVDFYAFAGTDLLPATLIQDTFSLGGAEPALLAAFGSALKRIDSVEGGTLLRSSTLQGEPARLYADLMFRQLHMLMQYADQARAAS